MADPDVSRRRDGIADSAVATGKGDDGTTGLLYGGRVGKDDARTEAYGTIDEAVACLGLARSEVLGMAAAEQLPEALRSIPDQILGLQRGLFVVAAELASNPDARDRLEDGRTRVDETMLEDLERQLGEVEVAVQMPREFIVPGGTRLSAALELSRTVVRRGERRVIALARSSPSGPWTVPYLNRLADLLWVMARLAEGAEGAASVPSRVTSDGGRHRDRGPVSDPG